MGNGSKEGVPELGTDINTLSPWYIDQLGEWILNSF